MDKAAASQICDLARVIDDFTEQCEEVSGKTSTALRSVFKVQVCDMFIYLFYLLYSTVMYFWEQNVTCQPKLNSKMVLPHSLLFKQ